MAVIIPSLPIIGASTEDLKAGQKNALEYCKNNFSGNKYHNLDSKRDITVSMKGLKHTLHIAMSPRIRACYALPEILEKAELTGIVPDKHSRPDILNVYKYEIELLDSDKTSIAVVVAFERRDGTLGFYDLSFLQE